MSRETNETQLKFPWKDGKYHKVSITDGADNIDIDNLVATCTETLKEKKDQCKNIYYLGLAMTRDSSAASGFLMGWIVKSLKEATEKSSGNKWVITHDTEDIPPKEFRRRAAEELRLLADEIENSEDDLTKVPIVRNNNGNELFE